MVLIYLDVFIGNMYVLSFVYDGIGIGWYREKVVGAKATPDCVATYIIFVYGERKGGSEIFVVMWLNMWYGYIYRFIIR